jgi:tRNA pseudouridine38-40 synthase
MVRALVATMLQVARGKISLTEFENIIEAKDCSKVSFAVPAHGLFLIHVNYPFNYFTQ